jgi:hypothetical protein
MPAGDGRELRLKFNHSRLRAPRIIHIFEDQGYDFMQNAPPGSTTAH